MLKSVARPLLVRMRERPITGKGKEQIDIAKASSSRPVGCILTMPWLADGTERGIYAASPLASPQANGLVHAVQTLKRPEGRAPGQCQDALASRDFLESLENRFCSFNVRSCPGNAKPSRPDSWIMTQPLHSSQSKPRPELTRRSFIKSGTAAAALTAASWNR